MKIGLIFEDLFLYLDADESGFFDLLKKAMAAFGSLWKIDLMFSLIVK